MLGSRRTLPAQLAIRALCKAICPASSASGDWVASGEGGVRGGREAPQVQTATRRWIHSTNASCDGNDGTHEFDLAPGMLLRVTCTAAGAGVRLANGAHDRVSVTGTNLSVPEQPGPVIAAVEAAAGTTVSVALPARFCGLAATTAGGDIELAGQLSEAPLDIKTSGGAVGLQRARATDAAIHSGGGPISAGELSAQRVVIRSGGGHMAIKRLFGLDIDVSTSRVTLGQENGTTTTTSSSSSIGGGSSKSSRRVASGSIGASGGDIELGAAYGERAAIETGGGALRAAHVSCSGLAAVDTGGGSLVIEGLEGNASLLTHGGSIKVHLHERFGSCFLDSAGGDIEVFISPSAAVASLQVQAGGGIRCDPALRISGELGPTTCVGTIGDAGPAASATAAFTATPGIPVAEAAAAAAAHAESARRVGALGYSTESALAAEAARSSSSSSSSGVVWNASRLTRGGPSTASVSSSGGVTGGSSKLVVNAGAGTVALRALSWMEAVAAKVRARGHPGSGHAP